MAVAGNTIVEAAAAQLVAAVRTVREQHPDEHIYGAMFHEFYGDGSVISWPMVTVGTEESLAEAIEGYPVSERDELARSLRWSGSDLSHAFDPSEREQAIADAVHAHASSRGDSPVGNGSGNASCCASRGRREPRAGPSSPKASWARTSSRSPQTRAAT